MSKAMMARIISDNEQDAADCREWFESESNAGLLAVWMRCQKVHSDPIDEIVTRLAALKLAEMIEAAQRD